ncbi:MAG TPA: flotillin domain-containing protein [Hyphomicrobiaceae bacterium]|jgi:uncharacterized membrane protein YqiK|nr:flotillin domain-containing protein [Hyphomicrobiaceae bacterium]
MTAPFLLSPAGWLVAALVAIIVICFLFYWFYRRATKETAFVRTGLLGQKVVINGGAFVVPIFHDVTPVNMRTQRIEVQRTRDSAIITKDRMRVDVVADFFVRVEPEKRAVATAAQAIGRRLMDPDGLREMVEGKFIDTLRSVAAEMTMEELHEKRSEYARRVREGVTPALASSGLQLEAVSLTQLDQTNMEYFNPSNAFDAEGLTRLTEEIERRKKKRNDIEQDTLIAIRTKNLETERLALEIDRETEVARIAQERQVEIERAAQRAQLAEERAARELQAQQAEISLQEGVERSRIAQQLAIDSQRIQRETELQRLEVERRKALEIAEQMRAIAVADQSRRQSEAQAAAERARAVAIAAEEEVFTARELAVAERSKQVQLIAAAQEAERDSTRLLIAASADKQAAAERAETAKLLAQGDAEAERIRALAQKIRHEVEAEGQRLMNEAQNVLSPEARASMLRRLLIEHLEAIVRESVKPLEKIDEIKILQVDGLGGVPGGSSNGSYPQSSLSDQIVNSALRYRAQAPLIDRLLKEIGLPPGSLPQVTGELEKLINPGQGKDDETDPALPPVQRKLGD